MEQRQRLLLLAHFLSFCLFACAAPSTQQNMNGQWLITLLDGHQYPAEIQQLDGQRLLVNCGSLKLSGEYLLSGSSLRLAEPIAPELKHANFELSGPQRWTVTSARAEFYLMPHLLGAELTRIN